MSALNSILNNIDFQLNNGSSSHDGYYEKKIKADLPYFKEQRFKTFLDDNTLTHPAYNNYMNSNMLLQNYNISNKDTETCKVIERELQPYINKFKNEFSIMIEKYKEEMKQQLQIQSEFEAIKNCQEDTKKLIKINQEDYDKKYILQEMKITEQNKDIEELKKQYNSLNRAYVLILKQNEDLSNKIPDLSLLAEKIKNVDLTNDKLFKEIVDNLNENSKIKIEKMKNDLENISKKNVNYDTELTKLSMIMNNLKQELNNNKDNYEKILLTQDNFTKKINEFAILSNSATNKIENYSLTYKDIQSKLQNLSNEISKNNDNTTTLQLNFKNIVEDFNNINDKLNQFTTKYDNLSTENQNLNNKYNSQENNYKFIKEKLNKMSSTLNDTISQHNVNIYNELNDKINKCQMNIDEMNDANSGKFTSINTKISELTLFLKSGEPNKNSEKCEGNVCSKFKIEQMKYNQIFEKTIDKLSKQLINYKNRLDEFKEDTDNFNENFSKIDSNFKRINEQINRSKDLEKNVKLFPQLIDTLSETHKNFKEKVEKEFENIANSNEDSQQKMNLQINELRDSCYKKLNEIKVEYLLQNNNNPLDSAKIINHETARQLNDLESNVRMVKNQSEENKNSITKLKSSNSINEKRINELNEKIPGIYNYIDNKFKDLYELAGDDLSNVNTFSERLKGIIQSSENNNDYAIKGGLKYSNKDNNSGHKSAENMKNSHKLGDVTELPAGYANSNQQKFILKGDAFEPVPKQADSMHEDDDGERISRDSTPNNITNTKNNLTPTDKSLKNYKYGHMNQIEIAQNKKEFGNQYMKDFLVPSKANGSERAEIEFEQSDRFYNQIKSNNLGENKESFSKTMNKGDSIDDIIKDIIKDDDKSPANEDEEFRNEDIGDTIKNVFVEKPTNKNGDDFDDDFDNDFDL